VELVKRPRTLVSRSRTQTLVAAKSRLPFHGFPKRGGTCVIRDRVRMTPTELAEQPTRISGWLHPPSRLDAYDAWLGFGPEPD
jgi:hypothetical protein